MVVDGVAYRESWREDTVEQSDKPVEGVTKNHPIGFFVQVSSHVSFFVTQSISIREIHQKRTDSKDIVDKAKWPAEPISKRVFQATQEHYRDNNC